MMIAKEMISLFFYAGIDGLYCWLRFFLCFNKELQKKTRRLFVTKTIPQEIPVKQREEILQRKIAEMVSMMVILQIVPIVLLFPQIAQDNDGDGFLGRMIMMTMTLQ